jgi:hypothetical protein
LGIGSSAGGIGGVAGRIGTSIGGIGIVTGEIGTGRGDFASWQAALEHRLLCLEESVGGLGYRLARFVQWELNLDELEQDQNACERSEIVAPAVPRGEAPSGHGNARAAIDLLNGGAENCGDCPGGGISCCQLHDQEMALSVQERLSHSK